MTAALYSVQWYRVARVKPRLRSHVKVQRQQWRGEHWFLLSDPSTGRQHRVNEAGYQFIGRCDGHRSVHEVWQALLEANADAAPTQDEVLQLLGQLNELELLQSDHSADAATVLERKRDLGKKRRRQLLNPFSFRLPLGDPAGWLVKLDPLAMALFQPGVAVLWTLAMVATLLSAGAEWPSLTAHAAQHLYSPTSLAMVWLVYPVMKLLHELAHALAVRRWGGEVHEIGIGLLLLVPAPYVDASAASGFTQRHARALVSAAGILAELTIAALAFWLWMITEPGLVNQIAFGVAFMGTVSSLLFNGNPLLRFDAYHVMCDAFDLPNLGGRSGAWWMHKLGSWLLGAKMELPVHAASERKWLWAYAPLSWAFRVVISVTVVIWLSSIWLVVAAAALAYMVFTILAQPVFRWARQAMASVQPGRELARVRVRLAAVAVLGVGLLFGVPLPHATVAPGVVWLPDEAIVRSEVDGFVAEWFAEDGAAVQPGDRLALLSNPELHARREQLSSRLEGLRAEQVQQWLSDTTAAQNLSLELERADAEIARVDEQIGQLDIRAQVAGRFIAPLQADRLGSFVRQGALLGHVLAPQALRVRVAVPEAAAGLIRGHVQATEVRLSDAPGVAHAAIRQGETPAATHRLPSEALTDAAGGPYAADPKQSDGLGSLEPVVLVDLQIPALTRDAETSQGALPAASPSLARVGGLAWARFDHGSEPLAVQLARRSRQLFLRHVAASG